MVGRVGFLGFDAETGREAHKEDDDDNTEVDHSVEGLSDEGDELTHTRHSSQELAHSNPREEVQQGQRNRDFVSLSWEKSVGHKVNGQGDESKHIPNSPQAKEANWSDDRCSNQYQCLFNPEYK